MGNKQSKIRPIFEPLGTGQFDTRMFTPDTRSRAKPGTPKRFMLFPKDASKVNLFFAIRYNRTSDSTSTEEFVINGNVVAIQADTANALRALDKHMAAIMGLTNRWTPCFWLDAICINERDEDEHARQKALEPYIFSSATYVLDLTAPKARIFSGNVAYTAPVINIGGSVESGLAALDNAYANMDRVRNHQPGGLVWVEQ